ncbi:MAG: hypothetical protein R2939_06735 [Kofleriaceae bacterium]
MYALHSASTMMPTTTVATLSARVTSRIPTAVIKTVGMSTASARVSRARRS